MTSFRTLLLGPALLAVLASVAAVAMAMRQQIDVRRTGNLLHGEQAYAYAVAAESWARVILRRDASCIRNSILWLLAFLTRRCRHNNNKKKDCPILHHNDCCSPHDMLIIHVASHIALLIFEAR